jgi:uncharacterized protein YfdQ (DUF2303 family)
MYNSERLKSAVLNYIVKSQDGTLTLMMMSSEWIQWSAQNEKLASDIVEAVFEKFDIAKY